MQRTALFWYIIKKYMSAHTIAQILINCFKNGNFLYLCGNGGSYDLARHMEEEFLCKFIHWRQPLPALAFKAHTSISNDLGYQSVFSRQVEAFGRKGDVLIGISTSGLSENVNNALSRAEEMGLTTIDFPRQGETTAKIQEYQLQLMHEVCKLVEEEFIP